METEKKTHTIGLENLELLKNKLNLIDTWRKNNPFQKMFTYHNADNTIHSRIDRIYISKQIKNIKCQIIPNTISDHDSVTIVIQVNKKESRGPGTWKLNTNILTQKEFKKIFQKFWNNWQNEKKNYDNHNNWWEIGKIYFKVIAIEYCTKTNHKLNQKHNKLIKNINEEKLKTQPDPTKTENFLIELEEIENYKINGTIKKQRKNNTKRRKTN